MSVKLLVAALSTLRVAENMRDNTDARLCTVLPARVDALRVDALRAVAPVAVRFCAPTARVAAARDAADDATRF